MPHFDLKEPQPDCEMWSELGEQTFLIYLICCFLLYIVFLPYKFKWSTTPVLFTMYLFLHEMVHLFQNLSVKSVTILFCILSISLYYDGAARFCNVAIFKHFRLLLKNCRPVHKALTEYLNYVPGC